jgi:hypothetical protein
LNITFLLCRTLISIFTTLFSSILITFTAHLDGELAAAFRVSHQQPTHLKNLLTSIPNKKENRKRQLKNFCDSCEVKEIQQLEAWAEKGENRFSKFQAH